MELDDEAAAEGNRRIKPIATRVQFESFGNLGKYETVKLLDRSSKWEVVFFEVVYSDAVVARVRPNRVYARPAASLCLYPLHDLGPKPRTPQNRRKPRKPRRNPRNKILFRFLGQSASEKKPQFCLFFSFFGPFQDSWDLGQIPFSVFSSAQIPFSVSSEAPGPDSFFGF